MPQYIQSSVIRWYVCLKCSLSKHVPFLFGYWESIIRLIAGEFHMVCAERPDIKAQFNSVLYQLLLDPSERVCFEAILCVLGKVDNAER